MNFIPRDDNDTEQALEDYRTGKMIDISLRQDLFAYQIQANINAGLTLAGRDNEGNYEWIGNSYQHNAARQLQDEYESYTKQ